MKTKLLRKVRKRYSIYWYPERKIYNIFDHHKIIASQGLSTQIWGIHGHPTWKDVTKEEAYELTIRKLQVIIKSEYYRYSTRRRAADKLRSVKLNQKEKVWYAGKI